MKGSWKVPFRQVYCGSFGDMLRQTFWCLVVIKLWPNLIDVDSCADFCLEDGQKFLEQHATWFERVRKNRAAIHGI